MQTVKDCAEGGDTRAQRAATTLDLILYRSFPSDNMEKVKEAIRYREGILRTPENSKPEPQSDIIEKVRSILAKDEPVGRISRMVKLNSTIKQCKLITIESIKYYLQKFHTSALRYLKLIQAGKYTPLIQTVAMKMFINSNLSP